MSITILIGTMWLAPTPIDMLVYQAGAREYLAGGSLYDQPFEVAGIRLPFIYPPFAALLLSPFTLVDGYTAGLIIMVLSAVLLAIALWFTARYLFVNDADALLFTSWAWGVALVLEPLRNNANFGQINMVVAFLVFLDIVPRSRRIPQGWLIGIAAAIKLTPAVMLLVFLIRRDLRALLMAVIGATSATLIGTIHNPSQTRDFYTNAIFVLNDNSKIGVNIGYVTNQSLKGVLTRLWSSHEAAQAATSTITLLWLLGSVLLVGIFFVIIRVILQHGLFFEAALVNTALMLLISPISWSHHWVWWPIWLAVLFYYSRALHNQAMVITGEIMTFLMLTVPPHWWLGKGKSNQAFDQIFYMKMLMNDYFFWALGLVIMMVIHIGTMTTLRESLFRPTAASH
ncbi:glycosyltransferase family 87 protein [Corynebacterium sp. HS2168-gen11]|uniref:glycosyltransferase family 87 protein n=1 Tax=Corynebacterium sp. HS2168-gen11 TaxID=2974027 RepID=UPI00216B4A79|nr:glycosyltransferase family 87 protein [Corynebacterium sp. HS2168-gen11]MCS4534831.1 DUF2029 domain-containing protein [Corynebacterium sp. HS2168-gen11]